MGDRARRPQRWHHPASWSASFSGGYVSSQDPLAGGTRVHPDDLAGLTHRAGVVPAHAYHAIAPGRRLQRITAGVVPAPTDQLPGLPYRT